MFVTYRPEGGEEKRWTFDPRRVRASQAEMIERRAGEPYEAWLTSVQAGKTHARRVMLWHLLSLEHPGLKFEDTPDFYMDELIVEHSVSELEELKARVQRANIPSDQRETILAALEIEIAEAEQREKERGGEGKAKSRS